MTTTVVGMRCPDCAKQKTKVIRVGGAIREPRLTYALIAVNVAVYLIGKVVAGTDIDFGLARRAVEDGEAWRIVTYGFLHDQSPGFGIIHILFNMMLLFQLGTLIEVREGAVKFGALYFAGLLAGALGSLMLSAPGDRGITVGASGAVFGLMVYAYLQSRESRNPSLGSELGTLILINVVLTFLIPNVSIGGHVGGIIGGALAYFLLNRVSTSQNKQLGVVLTVAMCFVLFAASWAVANSTLSIFSGLA